MSFKKKGFIVFGLGLALLVFTWLVNQPSAFVDLTSYRPHEVDATTHQLLQNLSGLNITLVGGNSDEERQLKFIVDAWKKINPAIELDMRPGPLMPEEEQNYAFSTHGLILSFEQQVQSLNLEGKLITQNLLKPFLLHLKQQSTHWVVFVTGHGEPDPLGAQSRDYGVLAKQLQGLKVQALNLAQTGFIPDNTSLLVITSPKTEWLPKESELVQAYLKKGGDLLWLVDFQGKPLPFLSHLLGVTPHPGIIVDKHGHELGTPHPAVAMISHVAPPFQHQNHMTAFPWSQALDLQPKAAFERTVFLETHPDSWTQEGALSGTLQFEPEKGEIAGPLPLGVLLERNLESDKASQRIIVIGNHRFATNAVIHNYGNGSLVKAMIYRLLHEDALAEFESVQAHDVLDMIPSSFQQGYKFILEMLIPITLIGLGLWINFLRRRRI